METAPSQHKDAIDSIWNQLLEALSEAANDFRNEDDDSQVSVRLDTLYTALRGLGASWHEISQFIPSPKEKVADAPKPSEGPLPGESYHKPLALALANLGGKARPDAAFREIERIMGDRIRAVDRERFQKSGQVIFENRIRFARNDFRENGLIDPNSRHGLWKRTEAGFNFARSDKETIPGPIPIDLPGQLKFPL
jgi:hypothetical protein